MNKQEYIESAKAKREKSKMPHGTIQKGIHAYIHLNPLKPNKLSKVEANAITLNGYLFYYFGRHFHEHLGKGARTISMDKVKRWKITCVCDYFDKCIEEDWKRLPDSLTGRKRTSGGGRILSNITGDMHRLEDVTYPEAGQAHYAYPYQSYNESASELRQTEAELRLELETEELDRLKAERIAEAEAINGPPPTEAELKKQKKKQKKKSKPKSPEEKHGGKGLRKRS